MWGREKMQELSAPAEFVEGEEQALNPLSDEDLQAYADIRRALKVNDYGKLAELKERLGVGSSELGAQAQTEQQQRQKPDHIVDATEMFEQAQMQEPDHIVDATEMFEQAQMHEPVKQQQQESTEQRTPEISVDDGVMGGGQKKYTFSLKGNRPIEEATPNSVIHINGQEHFGVIDKEVADATGLPEGKIFVLAGDEHFGVQHIEKDHGKEIKALGYQDVKEFIADILHGYERVFKDSTGVNKLDLVKSMRGRNNGFAAVELQAISGGYVLKTAFPKYEKKLKNKELLYSRPAPLSTPVPHTEPVIGGSGRSVVESTTPSVTGKEALNRQSITPADSKSNTDGAVGAVAAGVKAQGKESRVSTQAGDSVDTRFKVVEADDLIASHNEAFGENENYPQELQPRKRGRAASQHQVEHIISNLNPELLGDSKLASDGAPIVGSDNIV